MKIGPIISVLAGCWLLGAGLHAEQQGAPAAPQVNAVSQQYKLTVVEAASVSDRVQSGRASSQAIVKVTDRNDVPVPGVLVTFRLPSVASGGARFSSGGLTAVTTTDAAGVATSGSFSAATGSNFLVDVAVAAPGGRLTGVVPVTTSAPDEAASGASGTAGATGARTRAGSGVSGTLIAVIAAVAAAGAVGAVVALRGGNGSNSSTNSTSAPAATVGSASSITFGHP